MKRHRLTVHHVNIGPGSGVRRRDGNFAHVTYSNALIYGTIDFDRLHLKKETLIRVAARAISLHDYLSFGSFRPGRQTPLAGCRLLSSFLAAPHTR